MHIVSVKKSDYTLFQSQSFDTEEEKLLIEEMFMIDARTADCEISIKIMTEEEFEGFIKAAPQETPIKELNKIDILEQENKVLKSQVEALNDTVLMLFMM